MRLTINGQTKEINSASIGDLVGQLCKNSKHIIAEVNGTIVPAANWGATPLKDGDAVELVAFVGGG